MARVSEEYYRLRKAEIVEAAMKVCGKKTVSSITMQDIIDATGFSKGAIYRYYTNIDEIPRICSAVSIRNSIDQPTR